MFWFVGVLAVSGPAIGGLLEVPKVVPPPPPESEKQLATTRSRQTAMVGPKVGRE